MPITSVLMPQYSMTMNDGMIIEWLVSEGEQVEKDQPIADVETDKVVQQMLAPIKGFIKKILAKPDDIIPVGDIVCTIEDVENAKVESTDTKQDEIKINILADKKAPVLEPTMSIFQENQNSEIKTKKPISPLAKNTAKDLSIDFNNILKGSGPEGLIVKRDIENLHVSKKLDEPTIALVSSEGAARSTPISEGDEILKLTGIRKTIARRLEMSKNNLASVTAVAETNIAKLMELKNALPISYTAFAVKAVAMALHDEKFRMLNTTTHGSDSVVIRKDINISVSVATGKSLVTPVIKNADQKNVLTIADELKDLVARARENTLLLADMEGGTFTITNSGIYGSLFYSPIINYPQSAIIGMGKILKTPIVIDDRIEIAPMMYLCLSYDHRTIDGETGAPFLQRVKYLLENPKNLFE